MTEFVELFENGERANLKSINYANAETHVLLKRNQSLLVNWPGISPSGGRLVIIFHKEPGDVGELSDPAPESWYGHPRNLLSEESDDQVSNT